MWNQKLRKIIQLCDINQLWCYFLGLWTELIYLTSFQQDSLLKRDILEKKAESMVKNTLFPWYRTPLFPHLVLCEECIKVEQSASTYQDLFFSSVFAVCPAGLTLQCSAPLMDYKCRNSPLLADLWIWEPPPVLLPCLEVQCSTKSLWNHFDTLLRGKICVIG